MRRTPVAFGLRGRELQVPRGAVALSTPNWRRRQRMTHNLSDLPAPADFVAYTAAEVGRVRHQPLARVIDERKRLLEITGTE
jgi:hypothetical protein